MIRTNRFFGKEVCKNLMNTSNHNQISFHNRQPMSILNTYPQPFDLKTDAKPGSVDSFPLNLSLM